MKQKTRKNFLFGMGAVLLSLILVFGFAGTDRKPIASAAENPGTVYVPKLTTSILDSFLKGNQVTEELVGEGVTLLKNNGALPLSVTAGNKITVLGKNSVDPAFSGGGSSQGGASSIAGTETIDFYTSLSHAGFIVNPTVKEFYKDSSVSGVGRGAYSDFRYNGTRGFSTGETAISSYTDDVTDSFANYNDAALVFITRMGGEGFDLPRTSYSTAMTEEEFEINIKPYWEAYIPGITYEMYCGIMGITPGENTPIEGRASMDDHYLMLDDNEKDLIEMATSEFDKVIIVLNTGTSMELGDLEKNDKIDSILWAGYPGSRGFASVGKVISGAINPSGKTVDTYTTDFTADPTYQNFSKNSPAGNQYLNEQGEKADPSRYMVEYEESIYVGYRYYETRGYTDGEEWYNKNVVYPFGHGLSYTEFSWSTIFPSSTALTKDGSIEVSVKVTNKGKFAGKDVVQLYYSAPYLSGEIEKSHVELGGFAKTKLLQPGQSDTVKVKMKVSSMASYDYDDANVNDFCGYELDAGNYKLYVGKNIHDAWKSGESKTFTVAAGGFKYSVDPDTGYAVENRFDDVSDHFIHGESTIGTGTLLSRNDWDGTFPEFVTEDELKLSTDELNVFGLPVVDENYDIDQPWYTATMPTYAAAPLTAADNPIQLIELTGLSYDNAKWDTFMNQLTLAQMQDLITDGGYKIKSVPALGVPFSVQPDGPTGFVNAGATSESLGETRTFYCAPIVVASTWNVELANKQGQIWGEEGIWSEQNGIYAPGNNIHRSPFSGRNFEYYSEDPVLAGKISGAVTAGLQSKGVIVFMKHFALNDQETNRDSGALVTWATEQSMREIYFKAFEIGVKEGKATGMMLSLARVGGIWAGDSAPFLNEMLRGEWGFDGVVITDYADYYNYMNQNAMIRKGADLWLSTGGAWGNHKIGNLSINSDVLTPTHVNAMRTTAKNILYAVANSNAMNKVPGSYRNEHKVLGGVWVEDPTSEWGWTFNSTYTKTVTNGTDTWTETGTIYAYTVEKGSLAVGDSVNWDFSTQIQGVNYKAENLPKGLSVNATTGIVSGTVANDAVSGDYTSSIVLLGSDGKVTGQGIALTMTVTGGVMKYNGQTTGTAYKNIEFSMDASTLHNSKSVSYIISAGTLPAGLYLGQDGAIRGRTTAATGEYKVTVKASADGETDITKEVTITVANFASLAFANGTLTGAINGTAYTASVASATGSDAIKYTATGLPTGLAMDENGNITGTATASDTYTITVTAESFAYESATATFTLVVSDVSVVDPDPTPGTGCNGGCNSTLSVGTSMALVSIIALCAVLLVLLRKKKYNK